MSDRTRSPAPSSYFPLRDTVGGPASADRPARQQTDDGPELRTSYLFVDNARFWSMFAVVSVHAVQVFDQIGQSRPYLSEALLSPLKFGTIVFFLMSGFLAGRGLETDHPLRYLQRRTKRLFMPWLFWLLMMVLGLLGTDVAHHRLVPALSKALWLAVSDRVSYSLVETAFWFVPNLLFSLAILLLFRRFHRSLRFGAVLLGFSLFYAVNIYTNWIPSAHTEALLGFVFYLWLGAYAAQHRAAFDRWMTRVSLAQMFGAYLVTCLLAYGEAQILHRFPNAYPLNSLRVTNQIFGVAAVLFIYKFPAATWPRFVDVRKNTFGVYLTHSLTMMCLFPMVKLHGVASGVHRLAASWTGAALVWALVTVCSYGLALLLTKALVSQQALGWLVGVPRPQAQQRRAESAASSGGEMVGSGALRAD